MSIPLTDKLHEDFNFKKYNTYDVSKIKEEVFKLTDSDWSEDVSRQNSYRLLRDTESYFIFQSDSEWSYSTPFSSSLVCKNSKISELVEHIVQDLEKEHSGKRAKVLLTRLGPSKNIAKHQDSGHYLFAIRRHHIAILTDPSITFSVSKEKINMLEGECWEINNSKVHGVFNDGESTRVHLIIDIMPNKFINEVKHV